MKFIKEQKAILITLCVVVISVLSACSFGNRTFELSIVNSETKNKIAIGDTKSQIEEVLGESTGTSKFIGTESYYYDDENIMIIYDSNDRVALIHCTGDKYYTQKNIGIGNKISDVERHINKINNKTVYLINGIPVDKEAVKKEAKDNGYANIATISFGANMSDETVEYITIANYQTAMFGIVE